MKRGADLPKMNLKGHSEKGKGALDYKVNGAIVKGNVAPIRIGALIGASILKKMGHFSEVKKLHSFLYL